MKPKRKYVNTDGDCDHCKLGGRLYFCLLHDVSRALDAVACGICEKCANLQIDNNKDYFKIMEEISLLKKE